MNDNTSKPRTMTDTEYSSALSALGTLSALMVAIGNTSLPEPADCTDKQVEQLLVRTFHAIEGKRGEKSREVRISAKKAVDGVCHAARKAAIAEYAEIQEVLALKPALKAKFGNAANPPTSTSVKLSSVVGFFPTEWSMSEIVKCLHDMNYKLTPGSKKEEDRALFVNIGADVLQKALEELKSEDDAEVVPASKK